MTVARAFIGAGSNIEPERNIRNALRLLMRDVRVIAVSTVFRTEAIGPPGQPSYYNCVIEIETQAAPRDLKFNVLRRVEAGLGRSRSRDKYAPRTIDLDLLLYDSVVLDQDGLVLPDPDIGKRPFLIAGLRELRPGLIIPGTAVAVSDLAKKTGTGTMTPLQQYTDALREELSYGMEP